MVAVYINYRNQIFDLFFGKVRVIYWEFGAQVIIQDLQRLYKNNQQSGFSFVAEYLYGMNRVWRWRLEGLKFKVILWLHRELEKSGVSENLP